MLGSNSQEGVLFVYQVFSKALTPLEYSAIVGVLYRQSALDVFNKYPVCNLPSWMLFIFINSVFLFCSITRYPYLRTTPETLSLFCWQNICLAAALERQPKEYLPRVCLPICTITIIPSRLTGMGRSTSIVSVMCAMAASYLWSLIPPGPRVSTSPQEYDSSTSLPPPTKKHNLCHV